MHIANKTILITGASRAATSIEHLDVLVNNAGIAPYDDLIADGRRSGAAKALERQFAAFVPGDAA